MKNIIDELILKLCSYYDNNIVDKTKFDGKNLIDCEFIENLQSKLDELNIKYNNSKLDFLAKALLFVYNYDKACLLMTKKFIENPNEGKVSNVTVNDFCLALENINEDDLRDIKDSFYIKAGNFSMLEKVSLYSNVDRNEILEEKYGINPNIKDICYNSYDRFSSCYRGTVEAINLKNLGIKEYHQKLLNKKHSNKIHQYRKVVNG